MVETTSDFTSSKVVKIAQLIQEAQTGSASTELFVNRFAKYYTPDVIVTVTLVFASPAIVGAAVVDTYSKEITKWARRVLVFLVKACPCALVLLTPIVVVCDITADDITAAPRKGALIKEGTHLETLAELDVLAFA